MDDNAYSRNLEATFSLSDASSSGRCYAQTRRDFYAATIGRGRPEIAARARRCRRRAGWRVAPLEMPDLLAIVDDDTMPALTSVGARGWPFGQSHRGVQLIPSSNGTRHFRRRTYRRTRDFEVLTATTRDQLAIERSSSARCTRDRAPRSRARGTMIGRARQPGSFHRKSNASRSSRKRCTSLGRRAVQPLQSPDRM